MPFDGDAGFNDQLPQLPAAQDLELAELQPELRTFVEKLYERNELHRMIPVRTVLEVVAESERRLAR